MKDTIELIEKILKDAETKPESAHFYLGVLKGIKLRLEFNEQIKENNNDKS